MKRTIVIVSSILAGLLAAGIISGLFAGDKKISKKDVPLAVLKAFETAFPKVKVNTYIMEAEHGKTYYEFETIEGKVARDILYSPEGSLIEVEEVLTAKSVPADITQAIIKEEPRAKIIGGEKTTKGNDVTYEINIKVGKQKGKLVMTSDGKIIEKELKKRKEDRPG
jgi:hypothetical protein